MMQTKFHSVYYTKALAKRLSCDVNSTNQIILECLNSKTSEGITKSALMFAKTVDFAPMPFHPIGNNCIKVQFIKKLVVTRQRAM